MDSKRPRTLEPDEQDLGGRPAPVLSTDEEAETLPLAQHTGPAVGGQRGPAPRQRCQRSTMKGSRGGETYVYVILVKLYASVHLHSTV